MPARPLRGLLHLDWNRLRLAARHFGERDLEDAAGVARLDLVRVDVGGEGNLAVEDDVGHLAAQVVLPLLLRFTFPLAADREHVSHDLDGDILLSQSRQFRLEHERVVRLSEVDGGQVAQAVSLPATGQERAFNDGSMFILLAITPFAFPTCKGGDVRSGAGSEGASSRGPRRR